MARKQNPEQSVADVIAETGGLVQSIQRTGGAHSTRREGPEGGGVLSRSVSTAADGV